MIVSETNLRSSLASPQVDDDRFLAGMAAADVEVPILSDPPDLDVREPVGLQGLVRPGLQFRDCEVRHLHNLPADLPNPDIPWGDKNLLR